MVLGLCWGDGCAVDVDLSVFEVGFDDTELIDFDTHC